MREKYKNPNDKELSGSEHLRTGKAIFAPHPKYLKHGTLKGRIAVYLSDRRTIIYVKKGHNIRKAKQRYEELIAKYNQVERRVASGYQKKEEEENLLKD
jgi:hypothetical protein